MVGDKTAEEGGGWSSMCDVTLDRRILIERHDTTLVYADSCIEFLNARGISSDVRLSVESNTNRSIIFVQLNFLILLFFCFCSAVQTEPGKYVDLVWTMGIVNKSENT